MYNVHCNVSYYITDVYLYVTYVCVMYVYVQDWGYSYIT